jgi:hypothetical protein
MKKIIHCIFLILVLTPAVTAQPISGAEYIHPPVDPSANAKPGEKGSKLIYCQVLRLTHKTNEHNIMAVFSEVTVTASYQRAKMRNDYMLKRERIYLGNIFFADVDVLEESTKVMDIKLFMQTLRKRYSNIQLWAVLDGNAILY